MPSAPMLSAMNTLKNIFIVLVIRADAAIIRPFLRNKRFCIANPPFLLYNDYIEYFFERKWLCSG